ncbi:hypothetical protein [Parvularcula sp. IMCC14364]|uniref:hypothetical protein n=1 Tax=Parvularcula sp. IMCC14364 TaxID=3067902 RepID=UPI0027408710|nr:hypothetical protein [Parvularcula sp. IMCC14364]
MRFFLLITALISLFLAPTAFADQNDPGLDALFQELRDGTALDAEETSQRILEIWSTAPSPTVTLLYSRAYEAAMANDMDVARELTSHVTGLAPNFAQGWVLQATVYLNLEQYELAYDGYRKALELEPRHFIATTDLADILKANGEDRAAFDLYQEALKWNPHYAHARRQAAELRESLSGSEI